MRKHIQRLAGVAAGAALSAGFAQAQANVQLYGVIDAYVAKRQLASASGQSSTVMGGGGMTTSQWGMRGQEDLGSGLKTVFDISGFLRNDTGESGRFPNDTMFSRTAMVGIQAPWGTLRLGRLTTPNFISTIRLNPFGDSTTFNPITLHTYIGGQPLEASIASGGPAGVSDSAHNKLVAYTSPTFGGFTGVVSYSLDGTSVGANRRVGYSLTYASGPLLVSLSGEDVKQPSLPPAPVVPAGNQKRGQNTVQIGASYDFTAAKLFGQWSQTGVDLPVAASRDYKTLQLGVSVPMGSGKVLLSVAKSGKTETRLAEIKRTTWALGYDHDLSKRTDLYAVFMNDRVTGLKTGNTVAVGVRHRF